MSASVLSVPMFRASDGAGVPLSSGKVYTYAAGTTSLLPSYTDSTAVSKNTNPVILDANGEAAIWLASIPYKIEVRDSSDIVQWTMDNVQPESVLAGQEWSLMSDTPTYVDVRTFTVVGDRVSTFAVGRRVRATITGSTVDGTINSSVYTTLTTIGVTWDASGINNTISAISLGILATVGADSALQAKTSAANALSSALASAASEAAAAASEAAAAATLANAIQKTSDTGSAIMPNGTTAQRDGTPVVGYQRWNTTLGGMEVWNGASWVIFGNTEVQTGTFTLVASGFSVALTLVCHYTKARNLVTIIIPATFLGASTATTWTFSGLPSHLIPARKNNWIRIPLADNGILMSDGNVSIDLFGSVIMKRDFQTPWTPSGTKGIWGSGNLFSYTLI